MACTLSRRTLLQSGVAALGLSGITAETVWGSAKLPGETRALAIGGDYWHNPVVYEYHFREIFGGTGWRLFWAQSAMFITPAVLNDTDLLILMRGVDPDDLGFSPDGLVETRPLPYPFMTPVQEDAIVENVHRGMALLSLHGSTRFPTRRKYLHLVGMRESVPHGGQEPLTLTEFNPAHPITRGIDRIPVGLDQTIYPAIADPTAVPLFRAVSEKDGRIGNSGWCLDRGRGRVVVMLPGHHPSPWTNKQYKQMIWRAAHWALKRDIPARTFENGTPLKPRNFMLNADAESERP